MPKWRTYKNGITGHKYQDLYIVKGKEKGQFKILNEDGTIYRDNISEYDECVWIIDKDTADEDTREIYKTLYERDIATLTGFMAELLKKKREKGLDSHEESLYAKIIKVRDRKIKNKEY